MLTPTLHRRPARLFRFRLFALALLLSAATAAAQPPPLGPLPFRTPTAGERVGEVSVNLITRELRRITEEQVANTNATLERDGKSERVSLRSITVENLSRPATVRPNRPNSFVVRVPFKVRIEVHIPNSFNRVVVLPIAVDVFCDNWHTRNGSAVAFSHGAPPFIENDGNPLENVLQIRHTINARVHAGLRAPGARLVPLGIACSTVGFTESGTPAPVDDDVKFNPPPPRPPLHADTVAQPTIQVTFERLKRLPARQPGGGIVYQEVEQFLLRTFANYAEFAAPFTMREGEEVALKFPVVRLSPKTFDTLVVIGQVEQPPDNPLDSAFAVAARAQSYRPGRHVLQIPKWFTRPPDPISDKPQLVRVPAYELTYTVRFDPGTVSPGAASADAGGGR